MTQLLMRCRLRLVIVSAVFANAFRRIHGPNHVADSHRDARGCAVITVPRTIQQNDALVNITRVTIVRMVNSSG
jgi:hypothetical protein